MPETRAQKRSQVDKLDRSTDHKRARKRSSDKAVTRDVNQTAGAEEYDARLFTKGKGKQPERIDGPVRKDLCHVYLAGPEDFRSGLDEEGNERLEFVAEELLHRGREWGNAEMQSMRTREQALGHAKISNAGSKDRWADRRWRTMHMQTPRMYDLQEDAIRTWRYSAPPLPLTLELGIIGMTHEQATITSNTQNIPEWRRTLAAESFQLFRPENPAFKPLQVKDDVDPETPSQGPTVRFLTSRKGQTILLSPFSISGNSSEPLGIPLRPPDLEWLDPELDHLPDFDWGWDQGLEKAAQTDSQRESLTMWRQSLSGSQTSRQTSNQVVPTNPSAVAVDEAGMISYLTDPSLIEETVPNELQKDTQSAGLGETNHYQPLPLRLAPFELPRGQTVASLPESPSGPIKRPGKRRKGQPGAAAAQQKFTEVLKDVKPMKQELSPFILRRNQAAQRDHAADISEPVVPAVQGKDSSAIEGCSHMENNGLLGADAEPDVMTETAAGHFVDQTTLRDVPVDPLRIRSLESAQRQEMRNLMLCDKRFGRMYDAITENTGLSVPEDGPAYTQIPNQAFGAPIKMPSTPHPFHPSLAELILTHPRLRVRWLIPVHGPAGLLTHQDINPKFWPSPAIISMDIKSRNAYNASNDKIMTYITNRRRRDHLVWTNQTLSKFWNETSKLRVKGTCGPISSSLSGPYPDPFRPALTPLGVSSHRYVKPGDPSSNPTQPPVRAHIGDHIRIGCDLEHALIFRMWLGTRTFGSKPTDYRSDTGPPQDKRTFNNNPFLRVKLCLIGPLGEVLAVI